MGMHPSRSSSQKTPATISSGNQTLSDIANKHQQPRENCGGVQIIFWVKVIEGNGGRQRKHQQGSNDAQCGLCLKNISLKIDRRSMKSKPSSVTKFDSWKNNLLWSSIINHQSWINHLLPIINHHQNNQSSITIINHQPLLPWPSHLPCAQGTPSLPRRLRRFRWRGFSAKLWRGTDAQTADEFQWFLEKGW